MLYPVLGAGAVERIKKAGVLKVGSDVAYAPFEFMEGDKPVGFDIDIAQEIAKALGVKLQIINTSFDGIIAALKAKKFRHYNLCYDHYRGKEKGD